MIMWIMSMTMSMHYCYFCHHHHHYNCFGNDDASRAMILSVESSLFVIGVRMMIMMMIYFLLEDFLSLYYNRYRSHCKLRCFYYCVVDYSVNRYYRYHYCYWNWNYYCCYQPHVDFHVGDGRFGCPLLIMYGGMFRCLRLEGCYRYHRDRVRDREGCGKEFSPSWMMIDRGGGLCCYCWAFGYS